ncbi:basic leucine zipper 4 [Durio zibethinus]|uniref:Basic leucine zipper 4 n=1 Tax=Durio zibethinus TaxID=66656 RepID=A0A6P5XMG6_DURZI|nr:basic leucine zipper 4 [Durio zibethinus]
MESWEIAVNHVQQHGNSSHHPNSSTNFSSLSTEDDARDYQPSIVDDKRLRRMISNKESARISRMRKKQHIEELKSQVNQLQTINGQLSQKLINLLDSNHEILQENAQLKEKVSTLHMVLADVFTTLKNPEYTSLEHKSSY